jgi:hypothetical protein
VLDDREVLVDQDRSELEPNVIVGAEAKNVRFDVRPVMRTPECSDVGAFGIRAAAISITTPQTLQA